MISPILNALGLMKRSEHEARMDAYRDDWQALLDNVIEDRDAWEAKFKLAATDLAKQAEELNDAKLHIDHLGITFNQRLADAIQDYQADALLWRKARDKRAKGRAS